MVAVDRRSLRGGHGPGAPLAAIALLAGLASLLVAPASTTAADPPRVRRHLAVGSPSPAGPTIAGCPLFPADNVWNARVDTLPVDASSAAYIASAGPSTGLHPDFG